MASRLWFPRCIGCIAFILAFICLVPLVTTEQPESLLDRLTGWYLIEAPATAAVRSFVALPPSVQVAMFCLPFVGSAAVAVWGSFRA
ncbi:hypothetical protein SAMN05519103_03957 [Rhizobiales bacterium GAS113]|nr:hypothetical protein SAMN05519103_03957 [Rhizobiales bacterium GAS113]